MDHHTNLDEPNGKKSSRKRKSSSRNPLSHARGKQQSHENIWFRRTGAGYHLFVQYYASQPNGTVAYLTSDQMAVTPSSTSTGNAKLAPASTNAGGLSRASKRRKRRKKQSPISPEINDKDMPTEETNHTANNIEAPIIVIDHFHPLLQAMEKFGSSQKTALALQSFLGSMARPLPVTFRIRRHLSTSQTKDLQAHISQQFVIVNNNIVQPLPFGNHQLFFTARCPKTELGRNHPQLKQFLLEGSQNGTIARQELGSMLPLLVLEQAGCFAVNINKKLRVLDLCASPGSKTLQALELLCTTKTKSSTSDTTTVVTRGRILANDVNENRLKTLQEAMQRSGMPCVEKIGYQCQDARHLSTTSQKPWDILLCDVPCSGDGTIRKDPHILELWKPSQGQVLHMTQLQILQRAMHLVRVGGTICYSTCSLNPIENEAVVAAALQQYNGKQSTSDNGDDDNNDSAKKSPAMEILQVPMFEGLQLHPGITTWKVAEYREEFQQSSGGKDNADDDDETPHLAWYDSYEDACHEKMPNAVRSMWPPTREMKQLTNCLRLWPQDHGDSGGGFFLAIIRRNR